MKITSKTTSPVGFQKFSVTLEFEHPAEAEAFQAFCNRNMTVAAYAADAGILSDKQYNIVQSVLGNIFSEIKRCARMDRE